MSAPAIRVRHLSHRFGRFDVLRDVSFDVAHGEIFGFIGPNGAGKTTTIRVMATLLEPMAGRVEIDGIDVTLDPESVRRVIGYMPDHAGVYDRITVREYLRFFAEAFGVRGESVVDAVLELTDLRALEDKLVASMSKGQKQRLQLARILLHDPKILILDEPASDLDPRARIEMRKLLIDLRSLGKTILLSSHILTELSDVCTSVGILEQGRLVVAGPIAEIGARLEAQRARADASAPHTDGATAPVASTGPSVTPASPAALPGSAPHPTAETPPHAPAGPWAPRGGLQVRRRVRLRTTAPPEHVATMMRGGPGVADVEIVGGQVLVAFDGPETIVAQMVAHLVRNDVGVLGVEQERNELERIFLEVTRGEPR